MSTREPAIVLSTRPLGEADLLVVALTPMLGKVRAGARNARKSRRRFAGGLPGGSVGEATLQRSRVPGGLWRLDEFRHLRDMSTVGRDLSRFAYIAYLCEITDRLVREPEPDPLRFVALSNAIDFVLHQIPNPAVLRWFELQLLASLGLLPALVECCVCGESLEGRDSIAFEPARGGALCDLHAGASGARVSEGLLAAIRAFAMEPYRDEILHAFEDRSRAERRWLRDLTLGLIRPHLDGELQSAAFLAQVSRL